MVAILDKDILWATNRHKNLKYNKGKNTLTGELKLDFYKYNDGKVRRAFFNVEINFNESPKYSILPVVKANRNEPEIILEKLKKKIIRAELDRLHIDAKTREICLCIPEEEINFFSDNKFDIKIFFEEILEYYIYWINYYGNTGKKLSDYYHGILGYFELFADDKISLLDFYKKITTPSLTKDINNDGFNHIGEDDRFNYIVKCIKLCKPINLKKKKLKIHNKCFCIKEKKYNEYTLNKDNRYIYIFGRCGSFRNCIASAYKGIRKINIEIKKRKRENINSIF